VQTGRAPKISVEDGARTIELIAAAYRSASKS
jgi:hypothetical protein